ncbi:hypothetical protein SAURM35S_09866 [Streptomyces aurantiogriseus]
MPVPQTSSASVKRVPAEEDVARALLYVLWAPREASLSWYVEPDRPVPIVTVPLYWLWPVPVWMASHSYSFSPVCASVTTCSSCGVPSCWKPPTTVSYARVGLPLAAQTTLRGALSAADLVEPSAWAAFRACFSAAAWVTSAVRSATAMVAFVALVTPSVVPDSDSWTTRSPPRTGSPAYVRS